MNAPQTLPRHRLSIEDYAKMGNAGILPADARIELIDGDLIDMAPIGSLHSSVVNMLNRILVRQIGDSAIVSVQNPIVLPPDSEPQPDIVVLKPRRDWYRHAMPVVGDVLLLIEVADTTAERDREVKVPLYARHGIPEVWLVDLKAHVLEIYREPSQRGYGKVLRVQNAETASPQLLGDVTLRLADILPS